MRTRYIPSIIMLLAGTITCAFCLIKSYSVNLTLEILLGVLIIFYIIGLIARNLINRIITTDLEQSEDVDVATEGEETATEEEDDVSEQ
jgi:flagellar biosynthesis/type III secretory pathway M-ring protein FliF/YscJ